MLKNSLTRIKKYNDVEIQHNDNNDQDIKDINNYDQNKNIFNTNYFENKFTKITNSIDKSLYYISDSTKIVTNTIKTNELIKRNTTIKTKDLK